MEEDCQSCKHAVSESDDALLDTPPDSKAKVVHERVP